MVQGFASLLVLVLVDVGQIQILVMEPNIWNEKQSWLMDLTEKRAVSSEELERILKQCVSFVQSDFLV